MTYECVSCHMLGREAICAVCSHDCYEVEDVPWPLATRYPDDPTDAHLVNAEGSA